MRHPRAFVLGEWAAADAADVRPYAAAEEQQSKTQSEYLRHFQTPIRLTTPMYPKCSWCLVRLGTVVPRETVTSSFVDLLTSKCRAHSPESLCSEMQKDFCNTNPCKRTFSVSVSVPQIQNNAAGLPDQLPQSPRKTASMLLPSGSSTNAA